MPDKITFYAIVDDETTVERPYGLLRRLEFDGDGFTDEGLRRDFSWRLHPDRSSSGNVATSHDELVEVSHEQASKIIEYFREKWGPFGQPLDP